MRRGFTASPPARAPLAAGLAPLLLDARSCDDFVAPNADRLNARSRVRWAKYHAGIYLFPYPGFLEFVGIDQHLLRVVHTYLLACTRAYSRWTLCSV